MSSMIVQRAIDSSLARSIRRNYFRRLAREWGAYEQRRQRAARRNVRLSAESSTRRQFRDKVALLEKFVGPLLPACTLRIESGSRAAAVAWALVPEEVPTAIHVDSHASLRALVLLQPGSYCAMNVAVRIRAHAVDRVVQRAHVVDLPIADLDMQAINAEFSDLMPLACLAASILATHAADVGDPQAEALQVLLPTQHGVFLGCWCAASQQLEIRTFVDHARLNGAQTQAIREIHEIAQDHMCAQALSAMIPGWMGAGDEGVRRRLFQAWEHFGWRFDEDRLHPGLSDRAWRDHDDTAFDLIAAASPASRPSPGLQARG